MRLGSTLLSVITTIAVSYACSQAKANTGHWRKVNEDKRILSSDSGETRVLGIGESTPSEADFCTHQSIIEFVVSDARDLVDANMQLSHLQGDDKSTLQVSCTDEAGHPIASISPRLKLRPSGTVDVPLQCFQNERLRLKLTATYNQCIHPIRTSLNIRSHYRSISLLETTESTYLPFGNCGDLCKLALRHKDGKSVPAFVCDKEKGDSTERDFIFETPDFATAHGAIFEMDARSSTYLSKYQLSCIDPFTGRAIPVGHQRYLVDKHTTARTYIPARCILAPTTTLRIRVPQDSCIDLDSLKLLLKSDSRARYPSGYRSAGSCGAKTSGNAKKACIRALSVLDETYTNNFACENAESEFSGATRVTFPIPDYETVHTLSLGLKLKRISIPSAISASCVANDDTHIATIYDATPVTASLEMMTWRRLPPECIQKGQVHIRFESEGSKCASLDVVRLLTTSDERHDYDAVLDSVAAYASKRSISPGDSLTLYIHSRIGNVDIDIYRVARTLTKLKTHESVEAHKQSKNALAYRDGAGFSPTFELPIDSTWESGMYAAHVRGEHSGTWVTFIITQPTLSKRKNTVVLASTNTWAAYNAWGGGSSYAYSEHDESLRGYSPQVSLARPNPEADPGTDDPNHRARKSHLAGAERWLLAWMDDNDLQYDMLATEDLHHNPRSLDGYGTVVLNTHPEYWSPQMYDLLEQHIQRGGSVAFLGANGVYWRASIAGDQMEIQKSGSNHTHDGEAGGMWRSVGRPESALMGTQYTSAGYGKAAPYKVLQPNHRLFDGTNLAMGDFFGFKSHPANLGMVGASGWETDKTTSYTPAQAQIIAVGTNDEGGAEMLYYETKYGGSVFSTGSLMYTKSLDLDEGISRVTKNYFSVPEQSVSELAPENDSSEGADQCASGSNCKTFEFRGANIEKSSSAYIELGLNASQAEPMIDAYCLDGSNKRLQWLGFLDHRISTHGKPYLPVPGACESEDGRTRIQLQSSMDVDQLELSLRRYKKRTIHRVREVAQGSHCVSESKCLSLLRPKDNRFMRWVACTPGILTDTELSTPSVFRFETQLPLENPRLSIRAKSAGYDGYFDILCLDSELRPISTIAEMVNFPVSVSTPEFSVPKECRTDEDNSYRISVTRRGANCIAVDSIWMH